MGLGNPGSGYEYTRHNAGFMAVDALRERLAFPQWKLSKKHNALVSEGEADGKKVLLAKPQTFMNQSGKAVNSFMKNLPLNIKNSLVVHDDIDIPLGEYKVSVNRGAGGHHGVESVIGTLGTRDFTRIRIGILPARGKPEAVDEFVLRPFTPEERELLQTVLIRLAARIFLRA